MENSANKKKQTLIAVLAFLLGAASMYGLVNIKDKGLQSKANIDCQGLGYVLGEIMNDPGSYSSWELPYYEQMYQTNCSGYTHYWSTYTPEQAPQN